MTIRELKEKYNHLKDVRTDIEYDLARLLENKSDLWVTLEEYEEEMDEAGAERIQQKLNELQQIEENYRNQLEKLNTQIKDTAKQIARKRDICR